MMLRWRAFRRGPGADRTLDRDLGAQSFQIAVIIASASFLPRYR